MRKAVPSSSQHFPSRIIQLTGTAALSALLAACGGGGGSGGDSTPAMVGSAPTVTAEAMIVSSKAETLTLQATGDDPDGDALTFAWTQTNGLSVSDQQGFDSSAASFTTPDGVDTITLRVTVSDGNNSSTADIRVVVLEDADTATFVDGDNGSDATGDGSMATPYASLNFALEQTRNSETDLYVRSLENGAAYIEAPLVYVLGPRSLYGGYGENWERDTSANKTRIVGERTALGYDNVTSDTWVSGFELGATAPEENEDAGSLYALNIRGGGGNITVENNLLVTEDAILPDFNNNSAATAMGLRASALGTLIVRNNEINVGAGADAVDSGNIGGRASDGNNGSDGSTSSGGSGGSGATGGNGGAGGAPGNAVREPGDRGSRGSLVIDSSSNNCGDGGAAGLASEDGDAGEYGCAGSNGTNGAGGRGYGFEDASRPFRMADGRNGREGAIGHGGGGGGGGGSTLLGFNGGGGGGGGEGGAGGQGGSRGVGGGASIGIEVFDIASVMISDNDIATGNGGHGGDAGRGQAGGNGGIGGQGVAGNSGGGGQGGSGGNGRPGGEGGRGGHGGSGGGGPSFGIYVGRNIAPDISNNMISTSDGGNGGDGISSGTAGRGGWSMGIFDADPVDGLVAAMTGNTINFGAPGMAGDNGLNPGVVGATGSRLGIDE